MSESLSHAHMSGVAFDAIAAVALAAFSVRQSTKSAKVFLPWFLCIVVVQVLKTCHVNSSVTTSSVSPKGCDFRARTIMNSTARPFLCERPSVYSGG
jgi:hypothetical protein